MYLRVEEVSGSGLIFLEYEVGGSRLSLGGLAVNDFGVELKLDLGL